MADFIVSKLAYSKMLLHTAKYPHSSVNGILLAEKGTSKESKTVKYVDSIPLFHLTLSLVPMLEVALVQVDAYCQSKNLVVGGYYQANENFEDSLPNAVAYRIAEKIQASFPDACLFMMDSKEMNESCDEKEVYKVYQCKDSKWKQKTETSTTLERGALETASLLLQNRKFRTLVDFDAHLDDISLDWKNQPINEFVQHST